jgi:transposase
VHELDPGHAPKARSLDLAKHRRILSDWLTTMPGLVAELARDELADISRVTEIINALAKRIGQRVRDVAPALLVLPGCGELTAAKLVGEAAGVTRFKSEAAFARHAGVAPVPVWSGNADGRVRMTRSGNRQLNAALHRIAVTQIRLDGLGQAYYRHRLAIGDSKTEALRCLKRRLSRVVFGHLHTDQQNRQPSCQPAAA